MHCYSQGYSVDYRIIRTSWFIPAPHIGTVPSQKASVGMYSGCNYPHKSCLCTFWPCHPYFMLQFYSIVFYTCYSSFFYCPLGKASNSCLSAIPSGIYGLPIQLILNFIIIDNVYIFLKLDHCPIAEYFVSVLS